MDRDKFYNMCMTLYGWFKRLSLFTRSKSEKNLRKTLIDDMLKDSIWNRNNDFELFNSIYRFRWFLFVFWIIKILNLKNIWNADASHSMGLRQKGDDAYSV